MYYYEDVVNLGHYSGIIHITEKEDDEFALCGYRFGKIRMKIKGRLEKFKDEVCDECLEISE